MTTKSMFFVTPKYAYNGQDEGSWDAIMPFSELSRYLKTANICLAKRKQILKIVEGMTVGDCHYFSDLNDQADNATCDILEMTIIRVKPTAMIP